MMLMSIGSGDSVEGRAGARRAAARRREAANRMAAQPGARQSHYCKTELSGAAPRAIGESGMPLETQRAGNAR